MYDPDRTLMLIHQLYTVRVVVGTTGLHERDHASIPDSTDTIHSIPYM